ncbi:MAG: DUF599 domain-containing protein [Candidatus Endonucleobacter bathymodioli]|uniref:DUF599 domain-containing protein n=1 Tax=Candidatus Endonucleibacter bathymodioli TaxID=539814 RepID=A0AA90SN73_9GAMM|nr:DUF599 domain-containing protein [Candidatus Endonucleobacter bathymodioli]
MASTLGYIADWVALLSLLFCWIGYTVYSKRKSLTTPCLANVLALYRQEWMLVFLQRDNKISDVSLLTSLRSGVSFFASTSMLVIAGLVAGIASSEQAIGVLSAIPFVVTTTREMWEIKLLVMVVIFIYSFLEFTWSHRLYNFTCVVLGSAPMKEDIEKSQVDRQVFVIKAKELMTEAAYHFNLGLRSYYFAMATMAWFISPWLLVLTSMMVVGVLYRREFHSKVLKILMLNAQSVNI